MQARRDVIETAARAADLVIISGGVSVGEKYHLRARLAVRDGQTVAEINPQQASAVPGAASWAEGLVVPVDSAIRAGG